jgi:hypothetical protein
LERSWRTIWIYPAPVCTSRPAQTSLKLRCQRIHSSGLPDLNILKVFVIFLLIRAPGSADNSSFRLLVFSPMEFSFSGILVELGHKGIMAFAKALTCLSFFGIGLDMELVIVDPLLFVVVDVQVFKLQILLLDGTVSSTVVAMLNAAFRPLELH